MIEARITATDIGPALRKKIEQGLQRAIVLYHNKVLEALNTPNTRVRVKRFRGRGMRATYPNPSKPGEPPRKRTGWLQRNVVYSIDRATLSARVGVTQNARYGAYLEVGTSRMLARPFLRSTLAACRQEMLQLVAPAL